MAAAARPVRVLVVEDSAVVRLLLCRLIERDPRLELAGAVDSAESALAQLPYLRPDVISMDIHLPGMNGLLATREIMARQPTPIVIVSDAWDGGAAARAGVSMDALRSGALTIIEKPRASSADAEIERTFTTQLVIMSRVPVVRQRLPSVPFSAEAMQARGRGVRLVAMAASTGGPPAFERILRALPADFPVPIVIVQHMGAPFLEGFAAWLDGLVPLSVRMAAHRDVLRPGCVLVAPGDRFMRIAPGGTIHLDPPGTVPRDGASCPSADLLFSSAVEATGARTTGVLLTGMGRDGAVGLAAIRAAGGTTIAEDARSAVVFGMPRAAIEMGAATMVLPQDMIAASLCLAVGAVAVSPGDGVSG